MILLSLTHGYFPKMITLTGAEVDTRAASKVNKMKETSEFVAEYIKDIEAESELQKKQVEEFVMERLKLRCPKFAEYIETVGYEVYQTELIFKIGNTKLYIFPQRKKNRLEFSVFTSNTVGSSWFSTINCKKAVAEFFRIVKESAE